MSTLVPYGEPDFLRSGDSLTWKRALSDYPATVWTLTYSFLSSAAKITITASASGTDHLVDVAPATSAAYTAGWYDWTAQVTDGTDRHTVDTGRMQVLPDLEAATTYDNRSHSRIMLDALKALYEGRATNDQLDIVNSSHNGRSLSRDPAALLALMNKYQAQVTAEDQAARIADGLGSGRFVQVRFR